MASGYAAASAVSKALVVTDRQAARQNLHRKRRAARGRPVTDRGTQHPPGNHVRLPVLLALESGDGIIGGQQLERPHPRIITRIVGDKRRDEARLERHLAARKTVAAPSLEPLV